MEVAVRRATKDDAPIIAALAMKLVEQHLAYDAVRFARIATVDGMERFYASQTDAKNVAVLVAELKGQVVGFAYVAYEEKNYAELAASTAWLHDVYVEEAARRSGAGRALIDASTEFAKEYGASKLMLSVAAKNVTAKAFFEQAGFKTTMHEMMLVVAD